MRRKTSQGRGRGRHRSARAVTGHMTQRMLQCDVTSIWMASNTRSPICLPRPRRTSPSVVSTPSASAVAPALGPDRPRQPTGALRALVPGSAWPGLTGFPGRTGEVLRAVGFRELAKPLADRREVLLGPVDEAHRSREPPPLHGDNPQGLGQALCLDGKARDHADTQPGLHRLLDPLGPGKLHGDAEGDPRLTELPLHQLTR